MKTLILILLFAVSTFGQHHGKFWTLGVLMGDEGLGTLDLISVGTDIRVAPYATIATTAPNVEHYEYLIVGQQYRIRQNGIVTKIRFFANWSVPGSGTIKVKFWRKSGSDYVVIDSSSVVIPEGSAIIEHTPSTTITLQEGDYIGLATVPNVRFTSIVSTGASLKYMLGQPPNTFAWGGSALIDRAIPIEVYMTAPNFVMIGNSIVAGHPAHYSFLETTQTTDIGSTIEYYLDSLAGWTYQNMGIGSQITTDINARFKTTATDLDPNLIIIEGGVNDIAGSVLTTTIISNYNSMLDSCAANDIVPVIIKILPWTAGSTAHMRQRDSINTQLSTLATEHHAIIVDCSEAVGLYDATGDAGNLWDQKVEYNVDNVHFNAAGYLAIARAIYTAILNQWNTR